MATVTTKTIKMRDRDDVEAVEDRMKDKVAFDSLKLSAGSPKGGGMKKSAGLGKLKQAVRNSSISRPGGRTKGQGRGMSAAAVAGGGEHLQRCAVRAQYSKNVAGKSWAKHADYIERDGTGGQAFDATRDADVDIAKEVDGWQKGGDEHMFRLIISPEFGDRVDLKELTRETIREIERDLGTKLEWAGVCHFDTDNPHVHLAVRGRDQDGNTLRINPSYLQKGLRTRAQEATTKQLGFRLQKDVDLAQQRQITQQRFTDLDRQLLRQLNSSRQIHFSPELPTQPDKATLRLKQIGRLAELEKMGLAKRVGQLAWYVDPSIEVALRARQQAQDIQKSLNNARGQISDPAAQLERVSFTKPGQLAVGKMVGSGWDEKTGRGFILVEAANRRLYYIDQTREIEQQRSHLKVGKWVAIEAIDPAKPDHRRVDLLVTVGEKNLGDDVLDAAILASIKDHEKAHLRETSKEALQATITQQQDARKELVAAIALQKEIDRLTPTAVDKSIADLAGTAGTIKFSKTLPSAKTEADLRLQQIARLKELESLGLATKTGQLSWTVALNLETELMGKLRHLNHDKSVFTGRPLTLVEKQIVSQLDKTNQIKFSKELPRSPAAQQARLQQIARLGELERMGLATRTGNLSWKVQPDFQIALALREAQEKKNDLKDFAKEVLHQVGQDIKVAAQQGIQNAGQGASAAVLEAISAKKNKIVMEPKMAPIDPRQAPKNALQEQSRAGEPSSPNTASKKEPQPAKTVSNEFSAAASSRTEELVKAGVLERVGGTLKITDKAAEKLLDLTARKEGLTLQARDTEKETIGVVVGRRGEFALIKDVASGATFAHKSKALEVQDVIKLTKGDEPKMAIIRPAKASELVHELKVNRLDLMLKHEKNPALPKPVQQALQERREFWKQQQVEPGKRDWIRVAHAKAQELQQRREVALALQKKREQEQAIARKNAQQLDR